MRMNIGCVAVLLGMMGIVTEAAAVGESNASLVEKRGLSPIILQTNDVTTIRAIGVCSPATNNIVDAGDNTLSPLAVAGFYLQQYENRTVTDPATSSILQQPAHGILRLVTEADGNRFGEGKFVAANQLYVYLPEQGYEGKDSATILVDFGGVKVQVKYYFQAISGVLGDDWQTDYCSNKGPMWKISSTIDANGNSTLTSVEYQSRTINAGATTVDTATLASTLGSSNNRGQTTVSRLACYKATC